MELSFYFLCVISAVVLAILVIDIIIIRKLIHHQKFSTEYCNNLEHQLNDLYYNLRNKIYDSDKRLNTNDTEIISMLEQQGNDINEKYNQMLGYTLTELRESRDKLLSELQNNAKENKQQLDSTYKLLEEKANMIDKLLRNNAQLCTDMRKEQKLMIEQEKNIADSYDRLLKQQTTLTELVASINKVMELTHEQSKTSEKVYELLELLLLDSVITKTQ